MVYVVLTFSTKALTPIRKVERVANPFSTGSGVLIRSTEPSLGAITVASSDTVHSLDEQDLCRVWLMDENYVARRWLGRRRRCLRPYFKVPARRGKIYQKEVISSPTNAKSKFPLKSQ